MRTKFRYWSDDGVMLDWGCIMQTAFNTQSVHQQHTATKLFTPLLYRVMTCGGTLMQWTGLRDKKGKLIYEDDVVKAASQGTHARFVVKWSAPTARFFLRSEVVGLGPWNLAGSGKDQCAETCEVIGNLYENPEMFLPSDGSDPRL